MQKKVNYIKIKKVDNYRKKSSCPLFVESPGIEPGSKQATKKLSTRLFPDWIFDVVFDQKQSHNTYLLIFEIHPKLMEI